MCEGVFNTSKFSSRTSSPAKPTKPGSPQFERILSSRRRPRGRSVVRWGCAVEGRDRIATGVDAFTTSRLWRGFELMSSDRLLEALYASRGALT